MVMRGNKLTQNNELITVLDVVELGKCAPKLGVIKEL